MIQVSTLSIENDTRAFDFTIIYFHSMKTIENKKLRKGQSKQ